MVRCGFCGKTASRTDPSWVARDGANLCGETCAKKFDARAAVVLQDDPEPTLPGGLIDEPYRAALAAAGREAEPEAVGRAIQAYLAHAGPQAAFLRAEEAPGADGGTAPLAGQDGPTAGQEGPSRRLVVTNVLGPEWMSDEVFAELGPEGVIRLVREEDPLAFLDGATWMLEPEGGLAARLVELEQQIAYLVDADGPLSVERIVTAMERDGGWVVRLQSADAALDIAGPLSEEEAMQMIGFAHAVLRQAIAGARAAVARA